HRPSFLKNRAASSGLQAISTVSLATGVLATPYQRPVSSLKVARLPWSARAEKMDRQARRTRRIFMRGLAAENDEPAEPSSTLPATVPSLADSPAAVSETADAGSGVVRHSRTDANLPCVPASARRVSRPHEMGAFQ